MRHVFRRPSKMLRPEILIAALIFLLANGYRPGFAGVEGEESDKATAISNRMDKVRADLEKEIAPLNSKPLLRKGSFAPSSKNSRADRIDAALFHRFRTGQVFGYRVEIEIPGNSQTERFVGSPIFTVYAVDEEGCAEMFVNGKLENSLRRHQTGSEDANTNRDVWIG